MRILLMCEGTNEEILLNLLLDHNLLKFSRDDLIGQKPYHVRQLSHPVIKTELKHYGLPVLIYRIGDKQNDKLNIPHDLNDIVINKNIYKYCTKPELEILLILNENLERDYEKVKNKESPKTFAKKHIVYNGINYDQSSEFLFKYYGGNNVGKLVENIKKYKKYKKHNKDELYLSELLKSKYKL